MGKRRSFVPGVAKFAVDRTYLVERDSRKTRTFLHKPVLECHHNILEVLHLPTAAQNSKFPAVWQSTCYFMHTAAYLLLCGLAELLLSVL